MGYQAGSTSYRVYNPLTRQFISTRDVISQQYNKEKPKLCTLPISPATQEEEDAAESETVEGGREEAASDTGRGKGDQAAVGLARQDSEVPPFNPNVGQDGI